MSSTQSSSELDCVIVGGGIHGTYLAQRLLDETSLDRSELTIVDPNARLLASFREKARACGMDTLRSTFVHHIGTEPFDLKDFAEANGRTDELVPTVDYPPRPSLPLFLDHADSVIERRDLDSLHVRSVVETIHERHDAPGVRLETTSGSIDARHCVLAIGQGDRYRWPDWAADTERIDHVWDGFDPAADVDRTIVVGGGITAAQLACELSDTQSVTMLTRHPLDWELSEADPPWLNWSHIERELHAHPPGSSDRLDVVRDARNDATIPPYLYNELDRRLDEGTVALEAGTVDTVETADSTVTLTLERGTRLTADRIVLATGFEPPFRHPFVERVADELYLARGDRGMPLLDDETLAWQRTDGASAPLSVTGALALGTVGPYAPNIPGARRAADRITAAFERSASRSGAARPRPRSGANRSD